MKKLFLAFLLIGSVMLGIPTSSDAQTVGMSINVPYTSSPTTTRAAYLYLPGGQTVYNSTTTRYPLLFFLHGAGQAASPANLSLIFNSSSAGGPPYYIEHAGWPIGFFNPATGRIDSFIVIAPQANSWSWQATEINYITRYMIQNYRVDSNRICYTGLSAGAEGVIGFLSHIDLEKGTTVIPFYKAAAAVPMSGSTGTPAQSWANTTVADSVRVWGFGDPAGDIHGENTQIFVNFVNNAKAGFGRFTTYTGGHCCWMNFYIPSYTENVAPYGAISIYQWMLTKSRLVNLSPTASAGSNQTITLPTNTVTVTGSGTAGSGHIISSVGWSKISGPSTYTIASPAQAQTVINNLVQGTYTFRFTVTNEINVSATSDVVITVNAPLPVANAGPDQTVTLPTGSTVSLNGSASTGSSVYAWTRVSGPNNPTIASPSTANTSASGLIQGVYVFQLSVNNGLSTDQVQITVNPALGPCGSPTKYTITPFSDSSVYMTPTTGNGGLTTANIHPGDTLVFPASSAYTTIDISGLSGSQGCPIVLINGPSGQTFVKDKINLVDAKFVKLTGSGNATQYGFKIEKDPVRIYNWYGSISMSGRTKNVEVERIYSHHVGYGVIAETNGDCADSLNYPNWVMDSIIIHDNRIVGCWNQGMYLGNTSPDNAVTSSDPRPVVCNGVTTYPRPMRNGYTKVYNNYVDSTGRGGIQLASASTGVSEIYNNIIKHNGLNGDDAQGAAITLGIYTKAYVHHNNISNTYTWGIVSVGASGTNVPLRIEDNFVDSSGYLKTFDLSQAPDSKPFYDPNTEPQFVDTLPWPQSIAILSKANMDHDSTIWYLKRDTVGLRKNVSMAITIEDNGLNFQSSGHIVCNNVNKTTYTAAVYNIFTNGASFTYSTSCSGAANNPPVVHAGIDQSIQLPTNQVTLDGSTSTDADGNIVSYQWSKVSGPSTYSITSTSAVTTVLNLSAGVYVFRLTCFDNLNASSFDDVQVTVLAANIPPTADAGSNQTIKLPVSSATLNSSASTDPDGTITSRLWSQVSGPITATIVASTSVSTSITGMTSAGTYVFKITVTDNNAVAGSANVTVTVQPANIVPVASAGLDIGITLPTVTTTLVGSGTDVDGTIVTYAWTQTSGTAATIVSASSATTVINGLTTAGARTFRLTVTDNDGGISTDDVVVTVAAANIFPIANAGNDQIITLPTNSVTLGGSGTDADGTIASYHWDQLQGGASTITSASSQSTTVTGLVQGVYVFRLTVTDDGGASSYDNVQVTVGVAGVFKFARLGRLKFH